jgi:hypothetical protein
LLRSVRARRRAAIFAAAATAPLAIACPAAAAPGAIEPTAPAALKAVEGTPTGPIAVASFTDQTALGVDSLTATIDWGDGSTSAGAITQSGSVFTVRGDHTYKEEGQAAVNVTISDVFNHQATVGATMTVSDARLHPGPVPPSHFVAGKPADNVALVYFTDANPSGAVSDFAATVNWGDGLPASAGTVVAVPGGGFAVTGSHTFARGGSRRITVTITDAGGATTEVRERVTVAPGAGGRIDAWLGGRFAFFHRDTEILKLVAHRVPRGATLLIGCLGPGCFKDRAVVVAHHSTVKLSGLFHGLVLRPGDRITIEIDKPGFVSADYVLEIRAERRPKITSS